MDRRYIAPIIITIVAVIYFLFMTFCFVCAALFEGLPIIMFLLILFIPIGAAALIVYMLVERINEIRGGEEDEASKY